MTDYLAMGSVPISPFGPCFCTPIFSRRSSNRPFIQCIVDADVIERFIEVPFLQDSRLLALQSQMSRNVGDGALYCVLAPDTRLHLAERSELNQTLRGIVDANPAFPYFNFAVACFLKDDRLRKVTAAAIQRQSGNSGKVYLNGLLLGERSIQPTRIQERDAILNELAIKVRRWATTYVQRHPLYARVRDAVDVEDVVQEVF